MAIKKILTHLDFLKSAEIQNALVHKLGEAPASPVSGQIYYDTALNKLRFYNGSEWITADASAVIAGAGLTKTGNTIDAGAGTGIKVNANDIEADSSVMATRAFAEALLAGLDNKTSVRVATTANITIATALNEGDTIDGKSLVNGDRVLVKNQTTKKENGIYVVGAVPARATDADISAEVTAGLYVFVSEGTTNENSGWQLFTDDPITLGTTELVFEQVSGAGQITAGDGLSKTGNKIDVGAGTGIVVDESKVFVDLISATPVTRKFSKVIGDGVSTKIGVTHGLECGSNCSVTVINNSKGEEVEVQRSAVNINEIYLEFNVAPATNEFTVIIIG